MEIRRKQWEEMEIVFVGVIKILIMVIIQVFDLAPVAVTISNRIKTNIVRAFATPHWDSVPKSAPLVITAMELRLLLKESGNMARK